MHHCRIRTAVTYLLHLTGGPKAALNDFGFQETFAIMSKNTRTQYLKILANLPCKVPYSSDATSAIPLITMFPALPSSPRSRVLAILTGLP